MGLTMGLSFFVGFFFLQFWKPESFIAGLLRQDEGQVYGVPTFYESQRIKNVFEVF